MIKVLTYIALLVTIMAGSALLYRNQPYSIKIERAGEVKKDQEKARVEGALPLRTPEPFGPVPNVVVQSAVLPAIRVPAPTPAQIKRKPKKPSAAKLKSKWGVPEARPFSFGDLFNVK